MTAPAGRLRASRRTVPKARSGAADRGDAAGVTAQGCRTALAEGIPEAADERRFGYGLSCAVLTAAVRAGSRRLIKLDRRSPGDPSRPQMITILEYSAATAVRLRCLTHLAGWCSALGELLRNRWPDADQLLRQLPDREAGWVRR